MKNNIIIYGAGYYGTNAYYTFKDNKNIICYADNNYKICGEKLHGVSIVPGKDIFEYELTDIDIVVCVRNYKAISDDLIKHGVFDFYVMIEGLLFHTGLNEKMCPVEISNHDPYKKEQNDRKSILFVQNRACIRTHKIAELVKNIGFNVSLLYTLCPPVDEYSEYESIYSNMWGFTSVDAITSFVNISDFDIIHCSNEPDLLANIAIHSSKPVVFDTHDMQSIRSDISIEAMVLEILANENSDGNIYTSEYIEKIAKKKFNLSGHEVLVIENLMREQYKNINQYTKLSESDNEIHCVYEGGIVGDDQSNHRFFEKIWMKIAKQGVHVHFYSQSNKDYCDYLAGQSDYLHFEGNLGGKALIEEMTKYDCGLALFNVNEKNRIFLETGSANKVYEYLNAGLPVVVEGIESYIKFVKKYGVGIELDYSRGIPEQLAIAKNIQIEEDFLTRHSLTMEAKKSEIERFYNRVLQHKN